MRFVYDPEADAATVYLGEGIASGGAPRSQLCDLEILEGAVILLLNADDEVLGFEILTASRVIPDDILRTAEPKVPH